MPSNPIDPLPRTQGTAMPSLVINGKFLQRSTSRSGVYRVARELLVALDTVLVDNPALAAAMPCRLIVPGEQDASLRLSRIRVESDRRAGERGPFVDRLHGALWEQLVLPRHAQGDTLISLCNIGPVVYRNAFTMVHDAQVYSAPASYSRAFRTWYRFVLPRVGKRNKALLTVSEYSRKQLAHFGVADAVQIHVIHNGCDHVLRLVPDTTKIEAAGLTNRRYVVALANVQPHKNIAVLLKAFHSPALREVTLALFGPATREDFESQGHTVPPNVKFLGFVSDEQLAGLLREAVALAFPSTTEGFGLPPLEAMLLGCPTIAAPCGALPEVCGDAVLWADPHDPAQWARQIVRMCDDDDEREDMRDRGRAHAAQFTWDRAARRLLETVLGQPLADTGLMQAAPATNTIFRPSPVGEEACVLTQAVRLKIAIAIATAGRRDVVAEAIGLLANQSRMADELLICPARVEDFDPLCLRAYPGEARVLRGPVGLPLQRNVLLDACDADVVIFFDDDFLPSSDYVAEVEMLFTTCPGVVVATGKLLADGILGPGIVYEEGLRILDQAGPNVELRSLTSTYNGYGCNMAIRMQAVRSHGIRFDERLPLYAWLEDVDFSRQLASHGSVVQAARLRGVHLGTKGAGRSPGRRLGYSQVANPLYLARKGTMRWSLALKHMAKNLLANSMRSLSPEPWVDRRGRLAGNCLAMWDCVRGQVDPQRILRF
ncbi:glycosyltransferase [Variovorax sp. J22P240]|uniref:glycosyltransferase n=1 Tax=Variovorax sp. J22P240 TaxID=3053514 RepID=UPI002576C29E|nr:glycosyltransferase [Variovorax sp. J22P240]MDL9997904.1 glycosyltransferase [Variovorax sp. J22P240]